MNEDTRNEAFVNPAALHEGTSVLCLLSHFLPGQKSGGPVRSILAMVHQLKPIVHFHIVTSDRDFGDREPYKQLQVESWQEVSGCTVRYLAKGYRSYFSLTTLLRSEKYQSLYLNSFFNWKFSIFPLLARKVSYQCRKRTILAPRGELSPGALSIKWLKKRLFITSSRIIDLYRDVIWHASSEEEASEIRRFFPKAKVVVARNLLVVPGKMLDDKNLSSLKQTSPLRVVFVSRICEKKNLDFALEVLKSVRAQIVFNIYGPQEDPIYFRKCQAIISSLPDNVAVEFRGAVSHEEIPDIFMSHDVFLFPTKGENFGHVIYESLAVGTPVLISDRTPWSDLNEAGAGWIIPLEMPSLFTAVLNDLASLPRRHRLEMRRKAVSYSRRIANDKVPIEQTFKLFATVD